MRRALIGLSVFLAVMSGCTRNEELLKRSSITTSSDVFREVPLEEKVSSGYSKLTIYSSVKTPRPGDRLFDNSKPGTSVYVLLINIDGQTERINGIVTEDSSSKFNDPEAGVGIRYIFEKKVLIRSGRHNLIIAGPEDGIAVEKVINLVDGTDNFFLLKPKYGGVAIRKKPSVYGSGPRFTNGIRGFDTFFNGRYT